MSSTRRKFLSQCCLLAATATVAPAAALASPVDSREVSLDQLSFAALAGQVQTTFRVLINSTPAVPLDLVQAQLRAASGPVTAPDAHHEKFSLLFRGPRQQPLPQGQHTFEHPNIGRFGMFTVPVLSRNKAHSYYEAIFNRPVPSGRLPSAG